MTKRKQPKPEALAIVEDEDAASVGGKAYRALTDKQRRYVDARLGAAKGNGTLAYRMVYGMHIDANTAAVEASRLLRNPKIRAAIDELVADDPLVAGRHELQRHLSEIARGEQRAYAEVRETEKGTQMVQVFGSSVGDEIRAAELLLKTQGALVDKTEVTGSNGGPLLIANVTEAEIEAELERRGFARKVRDDDQ